MGLPDIPDDPVQIIMDDLAEILVLIDLCQPQRPHVQVVLAGIMLFHDCLSHFGQNDVHIMFPHGGDPIHVDLGVHHQAMKVRMCGDLP